MKSRRVVGALFATVLFAAAGASALETDQYSTWGVRLDDGTAVLNAKINLEIVRALATAEMRNRGRAPSCEEITREFRSRVDFAILQPIEVWATHSSLVPRIPATPEEEIPFRRTNIYGDFGPFDIGRWVPDSPTVEVNGVRFGTDKLSHFFSNGWRYREKYVAARERGRSEDEAQDAAIRWGILEERTGTGLLVDGVFSRGDLEANLAGMQFYLCLCEGPDPILALESDGWTQRRLFDWSEYVTPAWDESFHVSIYSSFRWRRVRPRLLEYCDRRYEASVVERMERYRASHRPSPNDKLVEELVRDGSLPDPVLFELDTNCPSTDSGDLPLQREDPEPASATGAERPVTSALTEDQDALMAEMRTREAESEHRTYLLAGLSLTSYEGPAASLGWLFTRAEADFDCRTICDLRGLTVQVEPGLDAGQFTLGYARIFGETVGHERFLATPYLALGVRGTLLRTWSDGDLGPAGLTFVGVQGQFTVTKVGFKVGALWHVGDGEPSRDVTITWGLGWGF